MSGRGARAPCFFYALPEKVKERLVEKIIVSDFGGFTGFLCGSYRAIIFNFFDIYKL